MLSMGDLVHGAIQGQTGVFKGRLGVLKQQLGVFEG